MFFIYQIIVSIIILITPVILIYRLAKNKEDKKRFIEKFSFPTKKRARGKLIWFHGASVGEMLSVVPLIKYYEKKKSINQILVTSSTLSSSKVFQKFKFKKTIHQFYPIDHLYFTDKFLNHWMPDLAIYIESEIWPCMFKKLKERNINLILLNARFTKKTFARWMKIKVFSKSIFKKITKAYPQNNETSAFLKKINTTHVNFIGNLKFAENNDYTQNKLNNFLKIEFKNKKIWVASSTHKHEEIFCAKTHLELKKNIKNLLTIIIPRHTHRVKEIILMLKKYNLKIAQHSLGKQNLKNIDIYIVDTFGETQKFHNNASSVFLGGSIIKRGGQNPLEAARYGAKIFHGPNVENFKDIYALLKNLNISKKVSTPKQLASLIIFKKNKNLDNKIKKTGAKILNKTIRELDIFINNEYKKT